MKISNVRTHLLKYKLDLPMGSSFGLYEFREALLVQIETNNGLVGWGEAGGWPSTTGNLIDTYFREMLLGRNPLDINVLWNEMYIKTRHFGQKGIAIAAISGVDIALWDIIGKYLKLPIFKLLGGGFREEIQAYAMGLFYFPNESYEKLQQRANRLVNQDGFVGVKMKIGGIPWNEDIERVSAVRKSIGSKALLMVDANRAYNAASAITIGRELINHNIYWFEEPVPPEDIEGYSKVKSALPFYIAGGECEYTRYGFRRLLDANAVDILQPEISRAGGITECRRIADLSHMAGTFYVPHMHGSAIILAANLHLVASIAPSSTDLGPTPPLIELDTTPNPFREKLIKNPFTLNKGKLSVPQKPGLGVEIDLDVVENYKI